MHADRSACAKYWQGVLGSTVPGGRDPAGEDRAGATRRRRSGGHCWHTAAGPGSKSAQWCSHDSLEEAMPRHH